MDESPPFVFGAEPAPVTVYGDLDTDITAMAVHGSWSDRLCRQVGTAVDRCFAEGPAGLIVDLAGLDDQASRSVPMWMHLQQKGAAGAPPVPVALSVPAERTLAHRLQELGCRRFLPVYARVPQARRALQSRLPLTDRAQLRLIADVHAPGKARRLIRDACTAWQLPRSAYPAQLIVTELVSNAVEHTGTGVRVLVSRRPHGLHIAVADGSPEMPPIAGLLPDPDAEPGEYGRGLQIVHGSASSWGVMPIPGGKVIWAAVREDEN